jgi:predicted transcriptional regulator
MVLKFQSYTGGGPTPKFTLFHVWKSYDIINTHGPIGRKALSQTLGIGEGSTRTILDKLIREGSVEMTKKGAELTERGRKVFRNSGISAAPVRMANMTISAQDCAVLVKGMAGRIATGYEQRDDAARAGAVGATTFIARDGKLYFPDMTEPDQNDVLPLRSVFDIEDGDAVVVGTAHSYEAAEKGAVTAALALGDQTRAGWRDVPAGDGLIGPDTEAEDLRCLALAVHELVGRLPVTMRSQNHYGVRCEDGDIVDNSYTGPVLEEVLRKGTVVRRVSPAGPYRGMAVVVVPIVRKKEVVAVFGVVDITKGGMFEAISRSRKDRHE